VGGERVGYIYMLRKGTVYFIADSVTCPFINLILVCLVGNVTFSQAPVIHACNPSYSGDRDQEDRSSKPAQAK
jgi:hypothetical protein